jgi:WD40 repeat protein
MIVSASWDRSIRVWNPFTWECERTMSHLNGIPNIICDLGDGMVAIGFRSGGIQYWDLRAEMLVDAVDSGHKDCVTQLHFHQASKTLISSSLDKEIRVWSKHHKCVTTVTEKAPIMSMVVSRDSVIVGLVDGSVSVWNFTNWNKATHSKTLKAHSRCVSSITAVGKWLFTGGMDGIVKLWDPVTWECRCVLTTSHTANTLTHFKDSLVSGGSDKTVRVWGVGLEETDMSNPNKRFASQ